MQTRNEVGVLLFFDNLLKLEWESDTRTPSQTGTRYLPNAYSRAISALSESTTSLMMIIKVDWKSEGFATGSRTVELDWNDWNSPVISRLKAKLLRKRTWRIRVKEYLVVGWCKHTKLDIAVLKRTKRVSSWAERSMLWTPENALWEWITASELSGRLAFKIECDDQSFFSWSHWHPNAFSGPHCWARKRCVNEVIEGEAFPNGLLSHGGHNTNRLQKRLALTHEAVIYMRDVRTLSAM